MVLEFPPEITLENPSCSKFLNFQSSPKCTFNQTAVTVTQGFTSSSQADTSLLLGFTLNGIQNPRS